MEKQKAASRSGSKRGEKEEYISMLKAAIDTNQKYEATLFSVVEKLEDQLSYIQKKRKALSNLRDICKRYEDKNKEYELGAYTFGAPFFKDEDYYPGPSNLETQKVRKQNILRYINLQNRGQWTIQEKIRLKRCVYKQFPDDEIKDELIDWQRISASDVPEHSADECKAMWDFVLHPTLRRGKWTDTENEKLTDAAQKHKYHNWDEIAKEIDCNRSTLQCFIHYHTEISFDNTNEKWKQSEEQRLIALVDKYKIGKNYIPWSRICGFFNARTREEIYNKFLSIDPNIRKGPFTEEEDCAIIAAVMTYNEDFKAIPVQDILPGRNIKQIKARYTNSLKAMYSPVQSWDVDKDVKLLDLVQKHGRKWCLISRLMNFRTGASCRHRFETLKEFINKNPDLTIDNAPRKPRIPKRVAVGRILGQLKGNESTAYIAETIQTELTNLIDVQIAEYFSRMDYYNNKKGGRMKTVFEVVDLKAMNDMVQDLLNIFGFKITVNQIKSKISNIVFHNYTETEKLLLNYMLGYYTSQTPEEDSADNWLIPTTSKIKLAPIEIGFTYESFANKVVKTYGKKKNNVGTTPKCQQKIDSNESFSNIVLPSNSASLIGLRTIMVTSTNFDPQKFCKPEDELILYSQETDSANFKTLFKKLFFWPSLMSYVNPIINENIIELDSESSDDNQTAGQSKRRKMK